MRRVGLGIGIAGALVVAACLDAGRSPPAAELPGGPARPPATPPAAPRPEVAPADLTPTVAVVASPPPPVVDAVVTPPPAPAKVEHTSPKGVTETCYLLAKFPFEPADVAADPTTPRWYRKDDFQEIATMCAFDFYARTSTDTTTAVGVCPKIHWSTPALEIYELAPDKPGKTAFEARQCPRYRHRNAAKLAKLKAPVYAQETESALLYFHFSRLLGNAAFVYPATYRTVARTELIDWSRDAIGYIEKLTTDATPLDGWKVLRSRHLKRRNVDVVGGSLAKNPRGELSHYPFKYYPDRKRRIGRPSDFRKRDYYKLVNSKASIADQLAFDPADPVAYHAKVQDLAYAVDFTNLVIMDHLFNQRDRAGNINSKYYHHFVNEDGHLRWKKKPDGKGAKAAKVTIELERLILKDNDDGLLWGVHGRLNSTLLVPDLRHLESTMYARIQWLAALMQDPASGDEIRSYFVDQVHIQPGTYDEVRERFVALASRLLRWHTLGRLALDLDLEPVIAAAPPLPADYKPKKKKRHRD